MLKLVNRQDLKSCGWRHPCGFKSHRSHQQMKVMIIFFSRVFIFTVSLIFFNILSANELEEKIKKYILQNPEIIIQSLQNYENKKELEEKSQNKELIKKLKDKIFLSNIMLYEGNISGSEVIVEFFDYNCSYCKRAHQDVQKVIEKNKNVKVIYKNFPILSENSVKLAKYAIAISEINNKKFIEFHNFLINHKGRVEENHLSEILKKIKIPETKIIERINTTEINNKLEKDVMLANELGLRGTPAFIIGNEIIFGYLNHQEMIAKINQQ